MKVVCTADDVRPKFFLSYSRQDSVLIEDIRSQLNLISKSVWIDIEQIGSGQIWRKEIDAGIDASDELVLLLSDYSIQSEVVQYEIRRAQLACKTVHVLLINKITRAIPETLKQINHVDLYSRDIGPSLRNALALNPDPVSQVTSADIESIARRAVYRSIWPLFETGLFKETGGQKLVKIKSVLSLMTNRHAPSSAIRLNAGLVDCLIGAWDSGLDHLKTHAEASNTFSAWYFYALHLSRQRQIRHLDTRTGDEALRAISIAGSLGKNSLTTLLWGLYEVGYRNAGLNTAYAALAEAERISRQADELPSEFARFYWCNSNSIEALQQAAGPYRSFIRNAVGRT